MADGWGGKRKGAGRKPKVSRDAKGPQPPKAESDKAPSKLTDRAKNGQFLPGNPLCFKKGHLGLRPNKYKPEEMEREIVNYATQCLDTEQPITIAGLRVWLGVSADTLYDYANGRFGKTEEDKRAYVHIMDMFFGAREARLEGKLERDRGNVNGVIHALNNQYSERWRSRVEHTGHQALEVTIDLGRAAELPRPIEALVVQGEVNDVS